MCQVGNIAFEEQTNSFFLEILSSDFFFRRTKTVQDVIGDVYCQNAQTKKNVHFSIDKNSRFCDCKRCKACCEDQKPTIMLFGGNGTHCFAKGTSRDYKKEEQSPFLKKFVRQSQSITSEAEPKKAKKILLWHNRVQSPLVGTDNQTNIPILILYTFSLQ